MQIRTEQNNDQKNIEDLIYLAFTDHPHHEKGAKPNEHLIYRYLKEQNQLIISLVAVKEERISGYLAASNILINEQDKKWLGLGPIAVHPNEQHKKIGSQLIKECIETAKALKFEGIVVLGEPEYYARFGFKPHPNLILADVPAEYFMILPLSEHTIPAGTVTYSDAFYI